jgi:hypothetical protein
MSADHDPLMQANYIRQCLAHDKRPLGLFFGAGCPMAVRVTVGGVDQPLIPDIKGVTSHVFAALRASPLKASFEHMFSHFPKDGLPDPNIEQILSHLRSLQKVAGNDSVRGLSGKELADLDRTLCDSLVSLADKHLPYVDTAYHSVAAWVGAVDRADPVEIFTTNYDLLMEEALERNRVPFFDGFVGSRSTFLDIPSMEDGKLPARWHRVWKIHGSLNWYEGDGGVIHRGVASGKRRVIYPSHLKYDESRRLPYFCMIDQLRAFFRKPAPVLITCGFSFGDQHLNEVLLQGLQGNPSAIVFALLYGGLASYPEITSAAQNRANLNVLARDEAVIGTKSASWIKGRDATACSDSTAVKWMPDPHKPTVRNAQFMLGDFANLATFANELIGEQPQIGRP